MHSQTKENYLKALYFLNQKEDDITVTHLSRMMEVSSPTVNNMVKKLKEKGWVKYEKYKPILLTELGAKMAALIIRKHRLAEMFLVKFMDFGWEEVHDIAEELEHISSDKFFNRMDELLNFPNKDPHGSPIPNKDGITKPRNYIPLTEVSAGQKVKLSAIGDSSIEFLEFLNDRQMSLGIEINLLKVTSFDKSCEISYKDHTSVTLSQEVGKRLLVELI